MVICRTFVNMKTRCKKTNSLLGGQLQYLSVRQGRQPPSTKNCSSVFGTAESGIHVNGSCIREMDHN